MQSVKGFLRNTSRYTCDRMSFSLLQNMKQEEKKSK